MDEAETSAWPRLSRQQRWLIAATMALVLVVGVTRLPPGPCFGDSGDLQMASATLGIAHSPGYVGYAAIGWLLCKILFFIEPAYVVSLACLMCIVLSLGLLAALLVRMGLHALGACAVTLLLVAHQSQWQSTVWQSMVYPEVYAPSWLVLIGTTGLIFKYARTHRCRDLLFAAFLFGFLVSQRPPSVLFAPGFVVAWMMIERRRRTSLGRAAGLFAAALCTAAFAVAAAWLVVLQLDRPGTDYNGIEQFAEGYGGVPPYSDELVARVRRLQWLISGEPFRGYVVTNWSYVPSRMRYIRAVFHLFERPPLLCVIGILGLGVWVSARRGLERPIAALGIIAGNLVFLCTYRVYGQAANLLPTVFAAALLGGSALAALLPEAATGSRTRFAVTLYAAACCWTVYHTATRYNYAGTADATGYLAAVDVAALPRDAVVFAEMENACPIWYARSITYGRWDIHIVSGTAKRWAEVAASYLDRPMLYTTDRAKVPIGFKLVPSGNLWLVQRNDPPDD